MVQEGISMLPVIVQIMNWGYENMQNEKVNIATQNTPLCVIEEFT